MENGTFESDGPAVEVGTVLGGEAKRVFGLLGSGFPDELDGIPTEANGFEECGVAPDDVGWADVLKFAGEGIAVLPGEDGFWWG